MTTKSHCFLLINSLTQFSELSIRSILFSIYAGVVLTFRWICPPRVSREALLPLSPILLWGEWFPPSRRKPPPFLRLPPHLPVCWRSPESIRYSSESPGLSRLKRRPSDGSCPVTLCWSHLPSVHPSCRTQTFVINTQERVSLHASISTMDRWRFYMWNRTLICEIKRTICTWSLLWLLLLLVKVQWSWQRLFFVWGFHLFQKN